MIFTIEVEWLPQESLCFKQSFHMGDCWRQGYSSRREVHWSKSPSSGGAFPSKEEAFHVLGKDLIAWFQDMHSYEDHSSSVSGIPCESLSDQVPQTHWWENLFSVFYPITGFPSTLPLSKEHGFYGKTEGVIGSNWRGSFDGWSF